MDGGDALPVGGERRPVTAVFADVVGSTEVAEALDPEDWALVVNRLFRAMSESITRFGGTVTQLSGDAVVALFGAPVTHEDDPERAIRAALDLVESVSQLSAELREDVGTTLQVRVGVNSGLAVVGAVGGPGHEEYTALGDAVNVAARMQTAALPGTVLVTEATYARVAGVVDATDRGRIEVKGKSEPVRGYEIAAVRGRSAVRGVPGLYSPMIGREGELTRLRELVDAARAGLGRIAFVIGEPGIGKSRLVTELHASVTGSGSPGDATWIEGRCVSYGHALPYHLVREMVRAAVGIDARDEVLAAGSAHQLGALLPPHPPEVADALLHLLGLPIDADAAERLAALDAVGLRKRYVEALRTVLTGLAINGPVVIVCEDLHWADAASVDLLVDLLTLVDDAPVVLLATARADRDAYGWRLLLAARETFGEALTEIRLDPLSREDSRRLIARLLEIESLPGRVRRLILDKTDGNPFFVEEVVRALIDQGVVVRRGDRWLALDMSDVELPDNVRALLLGRIDRLSPAARRCLLVASVVGRTFAASLLQQLADDVPRQLAELEAHGLVVLSQTSPELTYAFRHALVQEAAYDRLLRRERQRLHRRVADVLEKRHDPEGAAALLAHHLDAAGEGDRAVPYLLTAGRQALTRHAHREAVALFARARSLLVERDDDTARRQRVEAGLGETQAGFTFVPGGEELELLQDVLEDAERLGDPALVGRVHLWMSRIRLTLGEWYGTSPQLRASIDIAHRIGEQLGDEELIAMPLGVSGSGRFSAGEYREAVADIGRAVDLLQRRNHLAEASAFASTAAMASGRLGDFASAAEWLARAVTLAHDSGDPNAILDSDLAAGFVDSERGKLLDAMEHTRRAIDQANDVGNVACALVGSFFLGDQHLRMGDASAAIPPLEQSSQLAEYCDAGSFAALSGAWLAAARARAGGNLLGELNQLTSSLEAATLNGDRFGAAEIMRHRATLLASQPTPDWDAVFRDLEAAVATLEDIEARPALGRALHDYGMLLEIARRPNEAAERLQRAADIFETLQIAPDEGKGGVAPPAVAGS